MSSDIPGFYYDPVQQRYYRISSSTSNAIPAARQINERVQQDQFVSKQFDVLNRSESSKIERKFLHSRLSLLRQRQFGQISIQHFHRYLRSNFIENLPTNCFIENNSSFSLVDRAVSNGNFQMMLTSLGQCFQLIDYHFRLTLIDQPKFSYFLRPNSIDGARSSYFIENSNSLMSTTLLNDENHVIVRFLDFSSTNDEHFRSLLCDDPSASNYFYKENEQTIRISSSSSNHSSPLMIKCSGPCCYSSSIDRFAFNINNDVFVYDSNRFQSIDSFRVPIRRVTLNDLKFSTENSNLIYTTNGQQFQQWDLRQSSRSRSLRVPILCSTIRCVRTEPNFLLISSFDERINLIDLRFPTRPLRIFDIGNSSSNNPHFSFTIDDGNENFLAACSQIRIVYVWDFHSGRLLNRFQCPLPENWIHTPTKCSIASVNHLPVLGISHPDYCRLTNLIAKK